MGVEVAVARVAVGRHGEAEARALHAQHRGVPAGSDDRRIAHHVVVAAEDSAPAAEIRAGQHVKQGGAGVRDWRQRVDVEAKRRLGRVRG